ncbi:efflux RND transporter periplasmic adaptor subunit [Persicirhabdus sediminis]|uniref:Efflux RND transporter periplasmic adaptor subunit n=1 Tax=Persicirhabdus sediminis TaxID=454144 RepID=A0A8J7MDG1_9BACT|nr:efflux RND transporter periplasmic adaptor subunit [Persicirhabdus sediminis]MBK1791754.1 efflux RND transporter periplasmic adaptor subunit [Persicirhabdus sediminis]
MSLDVLRNAPAERGDQPSRRRPKSLAWLLPVALLLGFALIFALLFGDRLLPAHEVQTSAVVTIRTAAQVTEAVGKKAQPAGTSKGELAFQASGWVEPDPYTIYVPTLRDGVIDSVHVLEGQAVKQGDLLAELVDDDEVLNLQLAENMVVSMQQTIKAHCVGLDIIDAEEHAVERRIESLEAELEEANDSFERLERIGSRAISEQQKVQARIAVKRRVALLDEARAELPQLEAKRLQINAEKLAMEAKLAELKTARAQAQLQLDRTRISAPVDGVVLHLHAAPGKKRMLGMDDPKSAVIVELYQPDKLQARIDVPLNEAAALHEGQWVELTCDLLAEKTFSGIVTRINGEADMQRNTLQAKVAIQDPDPRLRPEMLMRARFFASSTSTEASSDQSTGRLSLYVDEQAIFDDSFVWVVSPDGKAERRSVKLGREQRDGFRHVEDGLYSGEHVILPPFNDLQPASRVRVITSKP